MIDKLASEFNYLFVEFNCHEVFLECWDTKQSGNHIFKTVINRWWYSVTTITFVNYCIMNTQTNKQTKFIYIAYLWCLHRLALVISISNHILLNVISEWLLYYGTAQPKGNEYSRAKHKWLVSYLRVKRKQLASNLSAKCKWLLC